MVLKSVERIKIALPEVVHVVMFYNDGTVFQTTFNPPVNIPKTGENLAEMLNHMKKLLEICKIEIEPYKKFVYETKTHTIIVLKLGENSNLALFFQNVKGEEINIRPIRKYLNRIEHLIDMDKIDLERQELKQKETELREYEVSVQSKLKDCEKLKTDLATCENEINKKKEEIDSEKKQTSSDEVTVENKKKELKEIAEIKEKVTEKILKEKEIAALEENIKKSRTNIEQMTPNLKKDEEKKIKMLIDLNNFKSACDKAQQDLSDRSMKIKELIVKIEKEETEKLAEKAY